MTLISVQNISKSFGDHIVLKDSSFTLHQGDRAGLVGPNGSGKSTLVKMILSQLHPDTGRIHIAVGLSIGYLPQMMTEVYDGTIEQAVASAAAELVQMEQTLAAMAEAMACAEGTELENLLTEYGTLCDAFEARDGYQLETRIQMVMEGLGLTKLGRDRLVTSLSGGERTRLGLALLLISSPVFLILDEPTNHLDAQMLEWLETYLSGYAGTVLMVSHDRQLLDAAATSILEVDEWTHTIKSYTGNYSAYRAQKQAEQTREAELYNAQQEEIRRLQQRIRDAAVGVGHSRPMKDNNKMAYHGHGQNVDRAVARNIRAAESELARIQANAVPRPRDPLEFRPNLTLNKVHHNIVIRVGHLTIMGDDGMRILDDVALTLGRDEHALITGPNGSGKSTLLGAIASEIKPTAGDVFVPGHVTIGYLAQEPTFPNPEQTLLAYFAEGLEGARDQHVAKLLSYQLFPFSDFHQPVKALSPGQARKVHLARLMELRPHLLLIDEPSNHLSFDVLAALEEAMMQYRGPMLVVSHDRWLIDRFVGTKYTLTNGKLTGEPKRRLEVHDEERMRAEIEQIHAFGIDGKGK